MSYVVRCQTSGGKCVSDLVDHVEEFNGKEDVCHVARDAYECMQTNDELQQHRAYGAQGAACVYGHKPTDMLHPYLYKSSRPVPRCYNGSRNASATAAAPSKDDEEGEECSKGDTMPLTVRVPNSTVLVSRMIRDITVNARIDMHSLQAGDKGAGEQLYKWKAFVPHPHQVRMHPLLLHDATQTDYEAFDDESISNPMFSVNHIRQASATGAVLPSMGTHLWRWSTITPSADRYGITAYKNMEEVYGGSRGFHAIVYWPRNPLPSGGPYTTVRRSSNLRSRHIHKAAAAQEEDVRRDIHALLLYASHKLVESTVIKDQSADTVHRKWRYNEEAARKVGGYLNNNPQKTSTVPKQIALTLHFLAPHEQHMAATEEWLKRRLMCDWAIDADGAPNTNAEWVWHQVPVEDNEKKQQEVVMDHTFDDDSGTPLDTDVSDTDVSSGTTSREGIHYNPTTPVSCVWPAQKPIGMLDETNVNHRPRIQRICWCFALMQEHGTMCVDAYRHKATHFLSVKEDKLKYYVHGTVDVRNQSSWSDWVNTQQAMEKKAARDLYENMYNEMNINVEDFAKMNKINKAEPFEWRDGKSNVPLLLRHYMPFVCIGVLFERVKARCCAESSSMRAANNEPLSVSVNNRVEGASWVRTTSLVSGASRVMSMSTLICCSTLASSTRQVC